MAEKRKKLSQLQRDDAFRFSGKKKQYVFLYEARKGYVYENPKNGEVYTSLNGDTIVYVDNS